MSCLTIFNQTVFIIINFALKNNNNETSIISRLAEFKFLPVFTLTCVHYKAYYILTHAKQLKEMSK